MPLLYLITFSLFLISCGKAPQMPEYYFGKSAQPLIGKSTAEIADLKYNQNLSLNCSIYVQNTLVDRFDWLILSNHKNFKFLNYRVHEEEMVIAVKISESISFLPHYTHVSESGSEYYMEQSPTLTISYQRGTRDILLNGNVHDLKKYKEKSIFENVSSKLLYLTTINEDYDEDDGYSEEKATEEMECSLNTQINPPYQHQWKKIK